MLLLLFFAALSCIYAYDKEYESCCVKNKHECEIAYKVLDRVLNHTISTGECIYLRNNTLRIKVNNDGVQNLPTGPYECIPEDGSSETRKKLFLFDKPDAFIAISFHPPLPRQHFSRGTYTALLSLTINPKDTIFEKWLSSTKDQNSRSKIEIHQDKDWRIERVKEGHEGHVQIVAMYEHRFMNLEPSNTMKLLPGFYGQKVIRVTSLLLNELVYFNLSHENFSWDYEDLLLKFKKDPIWLSENGQDDWEKLQTFCRSKRNETYVMYKLLDKNLDHYDKIGNNLQVFQKTNYGKAFPTDISRSAEARTLFAGGIYKLAKRETSKITAYLVVYKYFPGKYSVVFRPALPPKPWSKTNYEAFLSLVIDPQDECFKIWKKMATKGQEGKNENLVVNGKWIAVMENHKGFLNIKKSDSPIKIIDKKRTFEIIEDKYPRNWSLTVKCTEWLVGEKENCKDFDFPITSNESSCFHKAFNVTPPPGNLWYCDYIKGHRARSLKDSKFSDYMPFFSNTKCDEKDFVGPRNLLWVLYNSNCKAHYYIAVPETAYPRLEITTTRVGAYTGHISVHLKFKKRSHGEQREQERIKKLINSNNGSDKAPTMPTNKKNNKGLYPIEEDLNFIGRVEDAWGNLLMAITNKDAIDFNDVYCRRNVTFIITLPDVNLTAKKVHEITLRTFDCSEETLLMAAKGQIMRNQTLCRPENVAAREKLQGEKNYSLHLRHTTCTIIKQNVTWTCGANFNFSVDGEDDTIYLVQCTLFDCTWSFKVIKKLTPSRPRCGGPPRPAREILPIPKPVFILGGVLSGCFLFFTVIIFLKYTRLLRRRARKKYISEEELKALINKAGHNSYADDPQVLLAYTVFLEEYTEEKHERLKRFVSAYLEAERLARVERRQARRRRRRRGIRIRRSISKRTRSSMRSTRQRRSRRAQQETQIASTSYYGTDSVPASQKETEREELLFIKEDILEEEIKT